MAGAAPLLAKCMFSDTRQGRTVDGIPYGVTDLGREVIGLSPRIAGNFEWGIPLRVHWPAYTHEIDGFHCTYLKRIALFGYRGVLGGAGNVQSVSSLILPWLPP